MPDVPVCCVSDAWRRCLQRQLSGHLGEVYTCRMFPSGVVVLSGGADMQLRIWSAETGRCAATLRGHTGAVLDTAIVERGRNIISAGRSVFGGRRYGRSAAHATRPVSPSLGIP